MSLHYYSGQFWNIPVSVEQFTGLEYGGVRAVDRLTVDITTNNKSRSFTGKLLPFSWEGVQEHCLFVGNRQSGPSFAVKKPNDGVIEGSFRDYIVENTFSEQGYRFGLFNEDRCAAISSSGSGSGLDCGGNPDSSDGKGIFFCL